MCKTKAAAVNAAIFACATTLLRASPDKRATAAQFGDVLVAASFEQSSFARVLLQTLATLSGGVFGGAGALSAPPETNVNKVPSIVTAVNAAVRSSQRALVPEGDVVVAEIGCGLPIVPLVGGQPKVADEKKKKLAKVRLQPFVRQQEWWQVLQKNKAVAARGEAKKPTAFEFFAHAEAKGEGEKEQVVIAEEFVFDPSFFILRDEELGDFEARIGFG
jgi:hypothetical protein